MRVPPALLHDLGPYPLLSDGFIDLAEIELPQPGQAVFVGEPAGWVETSAQSSRVSRRLGSRELPGGQMFDPWPQGPVTPLPGDYVFSYVDSLARRHVATFRVLGGQSTTVTIVR